MYWDLSSDYVGSRSLVSAAIGQFGGLDQTRNHLRYPGSQFANMRSCMGGCPASATASTTATAQCIITTDSPPSSPCNDLYTWDHDSLYPKGAEIEYGVSATYGTLLVLAHRNETRWIRVDCHASYPQRDSQRLQRVCSRFLTIVLRIASKICMPLQCLEEA